MVKILIKISIQIVVMILITVGFAAAQNNQLNEFALRKSNEWTRQKSIADSIATRKGIQILRIESNGKVTELQIFKHNQPIFYQTDNANAAATISSKLTWEESGFTPGLSGQNQIAGIWDAGFVLDSHVEFLEGTASRIFQHDEPTYLGTHGTHLSGTMIAKGMNSLSRGMANKGQIFAYDFNNDIAEMASEASDGLQVSNHSYGPLCGWSYNTADEKWYWHGDITVSSEEDLKFGLYTETSQNMDYIAYHAPEYLMVKSAGNDLNDAPENQPIEHYIWDDHWVLSTTYHQPDGGMDGYECLSPMAVAKNILTVGAVEDLPDGYNTAAEVEITSFSSRGPTDDGRIKPDLVANGKTILSCGDKENTYMELSGTSMAAASISGSILLLNELQEHLQPGVKLKASSIKAILIHTADECGPYSGPDYQYGWGLANIYQAANLMKTNYVQGGKNIIEGILHEAETITIPINIPNNTPFFKATLCWTDPPGEVALYELNGTTSNLVNNLDMQLIQTNTQQNYLPWILNPSNPSQAAARGVNNNDNVEQVYLNTPAAGTFVLRISHQGLLYNDLQEFSLIISGITSSEDIYPPEQLSYFTGNAQVNLTWQKGSSLAASSYNIYRNGAIIGATSDTTYIDQTVQNGSTYNYYITASYPSGEESLPTNTVTARPLQPKNMPYTMNCESGLQDWEVKAETSGWRMGDSDSLNCYYLDFSDNTGQFFGIDSYSAGKGIHVSDIAISPPINLSDYEDIILSFDYLLVTGIYGSINELHAMYRLNESAEWVMISKLEGSFDWKNVQYQLPPEAAASGVQLGFLYDDYYKWGMGAGLDNIKLTGTQVITDDLSLESIDTPASSLCFQLNPLNLSVTIKNTGSTTILSGQSITITSTCNGIEKIKNFTFTENLSTGSSKVVSFANLIDPLPAGTHNLLVSLSWAKDQNSGNNSKTKSITINALPIINFIDPPDLLCEDTEPVEIAVSPVGGSFDSEYMTGNIFNTELAGVGIHTITYTYTDSYGCINNSSISIEVAPLPEVSFNGLAPEYCVNAENVILTGIPSGGIFDGPGITNNVFSPESAGVGTLAISYTYTNGNGCSNTFEKQTVVNALTQLSLSNLADSYCQNSDPISLTAIPDGGTFYINDQFRAALDPDQYEPGVVEVSYVYQSPDGCLSTISKNVGILALPEVSVADPGNPLCLVDQDINLVGQPAGGTFSGDAVIGNTFNPLLAGIGDHDILYTYEDGNQCTNSDTLKLQVVDLPAVSFNGLATEYCVNAENVILTGIPSGGIFDGPGITNNIFSPKSAGVGTHAISYTYTDGNGCSNTFEKQTVVNALTQLTLTNLADSYCQNSDPIPMTAIPDGGTFYINHQLRTALDPSQYEPGLVEVSYIYQNPNGCLSTISKNVGILELPEVSVTDPGNPLCLVEQDINLVGQPAGGTFSGDAVIGNTFNPLLAGIGDHDIFYTYEDANLCTNSDTLKVQVVDLPTVSFTGLASEYCVNAENVVLTGLPSGGIFDGPGITNNVFSPKSAGVGTHAISYTYTDGNGCTNTSQQQTSILDITSLSFTGLNDFYCQNGSAVELSAIPEGGNFNINGVMTDFLDPKIYPVGLVDISYTYLDANGCQSTLTRDIEILAAPEVNIIGLSELYCPINQDYTLTALPEGGEFTLEGITTDHFNPMELGAGTYEIYYQYIDEYGCMGQLSETFDVNANPVASIVGLDASYCPNGADAILTGVPSGGYFEGPGIQGNVFSPTNLHPGNYEIDYIYNQNGCLISASEATTITDPVEVRIDGLLPEYCPTDSLVDISGIPEGGDFSATPSFDETPDFNAYNLFYSYTDAHNCTFTDSAIFRILTKPSFNPPTNLELMEDDTINLELSDPELEYYWPNDSTSKILSIRGTEYQSGENILPIAILDEYGCVNEFEVSFYVKSITGITEVDLSTELLIYPNPANKYLKILLSGDQPKEKWSMNIFNLNGKSVYQWNDIEISPEVFQLDISNLEPGFYIISISGGKYCFIDKFSVLR